MTLCFQTCADGFVDLVINHPSVRPTIEKGYHRLASLNVLADHRNVCFGGEGAVALFIYTAPGTYNGHIAVLDGSRGRQALDFGRAALRLMFESHEAQRIVAAVPLCLPAAVWYVRRLGFVSIERDSQEEHLVMEKS